ncbi:hypothetical protein FDF74_06860 [Clostridium niameyense]|uniref:Uncharacterized protein n=1 Tax=Clostridium niameyense TaxID=1622073 RepID=A0A6M0R9J3_9CLOT|nr:hypothetical protein [Clostridium niameyense]NEZ46931.1 hypothetical protein [Clostridium niameyense]
MTLNKKMVCILFLILMVFVTTVTYVCSRNIVSKNLIEDGNIYMNKSQYKEAIAIYREALKYNKNNNTENMLKLAETMERSKTAYNRGIINYKKKNYLEAINCFQMVFNKDTIRYENSQNKLNECVNKYVEENMEQAQKYINDLNFKEAEKYLNNILKIDSDNEKAIRLKKKIIS